LKTTTAKAVYTGSVKTEATRYKMHITVKKIAHLTGHIGSVFALALGQTPPYILSGAGDGWLVEWDLSQPETGKLLAKVESNIFSLHFLPRENRLIAGNRDGGIHFIDLNDTNKNKNILHHEKGVYSIQVIENQLFTLGGEGVLTRWSLEENRAIESLHLSAKSLRCMAVSIERNEIAVGASDGHIYFLNRQLELKHILKKAHDNSVFTVKYTADGKHLISGGRDALLKIWDFKEGEGISDSKFQISNLTSVAAHWFTINAIAFHPQNPSVFATASRDKTIKIWHFQPEKAEPLVLLKVLDTIRDGCHINSVNALYWSAYNNFLISGSDDRSLIVWQIDLT
jgi:WD40 repeat protein